MSSKKRPSTAICPSREASARKGVEFAFQQRTSIVDTPNGLGLLLATIFNEEDSTVTEKFNELFKRIHGEEAMRTFNEKDADAEAKLKQLTGKEFIDIADRLRTEAKDVFTDVVRDWLAQNNPKEVDLTEALATKLMEVRSIETYMAVASQSHVKNTSNAVDVTSQPEEQETGYVDIAILDPGKTDGAQSFGTIIEVGISKVDSRPLWWLKLDQNSIYLEYAKISGAPDTGESRNVFDKPMLLVVMTICRSDTSDIVYRFGAFLCVKKSDEVKMSLLWRLCTSELTEAAAAFGKIVLASARNIQLRGLSSEKYVRLGPGCRRLGDKV